MKRAAIRILLVVTISSFALTALAYFLGYAGFSRILPFFTDQNFENSDRDEQLKGHQRGLEAYLTNMLPPVLIVGTTHFKKVPYFASLSPLDRRIFSLRC